MKVHFVYHDHKNDLFGCKYALGLPDYVTNKTEKVTCGACKRYLTALGWRLFGAGHSYRNLFKRKS